MASLNSLQTPHYRNQLKWGDLMAATIHRSKADGRLSRLQQGIFRLCEAELATFQDKDGIISFHPVLHTWAKLRLEKALLKDMALSISGSVLAIAIGDAVDWNPNSTYLRRHVEAYLSNENWNVKDTADFWNELGKRTAFASL